MMWSKCQWRKVRKVDWEVKLDIELTELCASRSVCLRAGLLDDRRACLIRASKYGTIGLQMSNNSTSGWKIITINTNLTLNSYIVWPWTWRICYGCLFVFHSWITGIDIVNYFHIKSEISLHTGVKGKIVKIGTIRMIRKLLKGETVAWFSGSVCMCVFLLGVELWGERTHIDKSYGHQSGPAYSMPKSIVPLIIRGRHPDRALHTASFIPADLFAQQTFCFGLGDL